MKIEQFDAVGVQPPQAFLALSPQGGGPGVAGLLAVRAPVQPALGGNHHRVAPTAHRAGDQPLAFARAAVHVGGVEMVDAQVEAGFDGRDALGVAGAGAGHAGDRPAAQRDFGDFEARGGQGR